LVTAGVSCVNCKHSHGLLERPQPSADHKEPSHE
jgi:hypothetical protein